MARSPYVGITGFTSRAEVAVVISAFERAFPSVDRMLMVGVLASSKTIAGGRNKYQLRYPMVGDIAGIFARHPRELNLVHFASPEPPTLEVLTKLFDAAGERCDGVQFNGAWPDPGDLRRSMWGCWCPPRVVLQVREFGDAFVVEQAVSPFRGVVTDILLDASMGTGKPMDVAAVEAAVEGLHRLGIQKWVGIGIAGGLCAASLPAIARLLRAFPRLSIDAEGRLRDDADGGGRLMYEEVEGYLTAAARAMEVTRG
jgi:hypothetical protein